MQLANLFLASLRLTEIIAQSHGNLLQTCWICPPLIPFSVVYFDFIETKLKNLYKAKSYSSILYLRGYGESVSPKGWEHHKTSSLVNDIKEIVSALTCITETADWMKKIQKCLILCMHLVNFVMKYFIDSKDTF